MRSSLDIQKEIAALSARVDAIVAVAKEEGRDLLDDEKTEVSLAINRISGMFFSPTD